jgi:outer membrane murein-binding lipoprotein Lpp
VKKVLAGFALVALLIVVAGCPNPQKITDLEKQVADGQMHITELEGTVQTLMMERDSLQKVITDMMAKKPGTGGTGGTGGGTGGRVPLPPTKKGSK